MTRIPPVLLMLIIVITMWLVDWLVDAGQFSLPYRNLISGLLMSSGFLVTFTGLWLFRQSTTVGPVNSEPTCQLVTSGIYQFTRNPMYLGMLLVLLSWIVYLGSLVNIALLIVYIWFINRYLIPPEEKALGEIFGERYQQYCSRVRRWM